MEPLTDLGIKLAVDDVGAGYASLSHILELAPDVVKLDISLTRAIERDMSRQALVAALVTFADRVDARLVAEGVETTAARDVLRTLGVRFGQGYLLGKPKPVHQVISEITTHTAHRVVAPAWHLLAYSEHSEPARTHVGRPREGIEPQSGSRGCGA